MPGNDDAKLADAIAVMCQGDIPSAAARIAQIEYEYWRQFDGDADPFDAGMFMAAMGAASNIQVALLRGLTPEQYAAEVAKRPV